MQRTQQALIKFGLCAILTLSCISPGYSEDKAANPTGSWSWTSPGRNGGPERKMTLDLKVDGEKVTGSLTSPGRDGQTNKTEIADCKLKDSDISFTVTREFNGNKMVTKYNGKVTADSIKGKIESERNGETQSRDWEAKRDAAAKPEAGKK